MKILITDGNGNDVVYRLNDTEAAHALYNQLPLQVNMMSYSSNEKGFEPPKKLGTFNTPLAPGGLEGLCYHKPWNTVLLVYGGYSDYEDLYELGMPVSGQGQIRNLKGHCYVDAIY